MMSTLKLQNHPVQSSFLYSLVGFTSSLFHDLILTPTEAVKQRLQLLRSHNPSITPQYVIQTMYQNEGFKSFYKSFGVNYFMNVPFGALIVTINETLKAKYFTDQSDSLYKYFMFAGIAGLLASVPTCPLDVIKTRLNTQDCVKGMCHKESICKSAAPRIEQSTAKAPVHGLAMFLTPVQQISTVRMSNYCVKYPTVKDAIAGIYKEAGVLGFFKGLKMRVLIQGPSSAISWGTYEVFKRVLAGETI
jgi:solute carrier family 25 iron transporter 28/37